VRVELIDQPNRGLAGAVDSGLGRVTGEFLTWPDPDDWLSPDSISERVKIFRDNPYAAVLRSNAEIFVDSEGVFRGTFAEPGDWIRPAHRLFENLLFLKVFFAPVCHMVRTRSFLEIYPERQIYVTPSASQNLQMLLPLVERSRAIETGQCFAVWRKRDDSRSQRPRTPLEMIPRLAMLHDVSVHVTEKLIHAPELARYWTDQNFLRNKLLPVAFEARTKDHALTYLHQAKLNWLVSSLAKIMIHLWCRSNRHEMTSQCLSQDSFPLRLFRRTVRFRTEHRRYPTPYDKTDAWNTEMQTPRRFARLCQAIVPKGGRLRLR
jgi:hypothetical protein